MDILKIDYLNYIKAAHTFKSLDRDGIFNYTCLHLKENFGTDCRRFYSDLFEVEGANEGKLFMMDESELHDVRLTMLILCAEVLKSEQIDLSEQEATDGE